MKTKRILALFLSVVTCLSLAVSASAANTTTRKATDFKDYDAKAWYAEAVSAAVDNGLLYGKSKTQLDPNGLLTRAEMAAITNRSFGCYTAASWICRKAGHYPQRRLPLPRTMLLCPHP